MNDDAARHGEWLDHMYNNRARVPEHPAALARWAADSAAVRRALPGHLDVRYGEGPNEALDIFPAQRRDAPVLVFVHGGYWQALDKSDHSFLAPAFHDAGACVVVPNYALCPAVSVVDITLQMVQALVWVWRNIGRFGGDPGRITVVGHSAGGQLAAMLLACQWSTIHPDLPANLVRNALSISGLHELESIMHTPFLQRGLRLTPEQVRMASPAWLPAPAQGVLYAVTGAEESAEFLRQNSLIQSAWGAGTVPVCEELPGLNHFSIVDALAQPTHRLHQLALDLLEA